jgi:hypothetical protein
MSLIWIIPTIVGSVIGIGAVSMIGTSKPSGSSGNNLLPQYENGNWAERPSEFGQGIRKHKKSGKRASAFAYKSKGKGKGTKKHRSKKHK